MGDRAKAGRGAGRELVSSGEPKEPEAMLVSGAGARESRLKAKSKAKTKNQNLGVPREFGSQPLTKSVLMRLTAFWMRPLPSQRMTRTIRLGNIA